MTVKELIEELQKLSPNAEVILQKDSEGNGYSPLFAVDGDAVYAADTTWAGVVYNTKWTAEESCMEPDEWEKLKQQPRCVVMAPIN